jgi:hypothetical protein
MPQLFMQLISAAQFDTPADIQAVCPATTNSDVGDWQAVSMGPMVVLQSRQRRRIGGALILESP